jgi:protein-S-isoprenylcysteine O-methyltransferase Ste14
VGVGTSIFLIAVGAILKFAVTAEVSGVDLDTVGLILMVVGGIGLLLSIFWMTVWADRRRGTVVADRAVATEPVARERVVERDRY